MGYKQKSKIPCHRCGRPEGKKGKVEGEDEKVWGERVLAFKPLWLC